MLRPYAVVTGASSGIGASLSKFLLSQNWNVCLIARTLNKMKNITHSFTTDRYLNIKCDLNEPNKCISACKKINKWCNNNLHLLVNNAAISKVNCETESNNATIEHWNYTMNVNLRAPYIFTKYLIQSLKNGAKNPFDAKYDGCIINVSSILGQMYDPTSTPYNVSKAGLNSLTKCTALEFSKYKVRINALILAVFDTPMIDLVGFDDSQLMRNEIFPSLHPLKRIGQTNDTNQMILFLCDKTKSGFTTGALINLDGGMLLGPPQEIQDNQDSGVLAQSKL
eukprot:113855_1